MELVQSQAVAAAREGLRRFLATNCLLDLEDAIVKVNLFCF
jgi:hypothetical protein